MTIVFSRRTALLATGLGALGVAAAPASASARPSVVHGVAPALHPEGVTWDSGRGAFLVGSVRHGTVSVVRRDGTVRTLVDDGVMVSTLAVHVDPARGRVLATYQDPGVGARSSAATMYRQSGLGVFDLATGAVLHRVDLSAVPGSTVGVHGANDFALDASGNAYVTDIVSGEILRVDPAAGRATLLLSRPDLLGRDGVGPNGVVWHPGGFLLVVRYDTGSLLRVPVHAPGRISEVRLDEPVVGGDGLALRPDGTLAVVVNRLASAATPGVAILRSEDGWASARTVARSAPWPDPNPTTAVATAHGTYVIEGRLADLFAGTLDDTFTIRALR
ncbi:SMP-30/gluconolactonase/LRE family protein [Streptomyces sp. NPDC000878]